MADAKKSLMLMGTLGVILLILVVVFAVALLVGSEFKEQICDNDGGVANGGNCWTDTNFNVSLESESFNATVDLIGEITTVVGFIGLVVLTAIGAILIGMARGFMKDGDL